MDVISLGKAMKTIRDTRKLNKEIIGQEAESHFKTVDHRLDWIEGQADKILVESGHKANLSIGQFDNIEVVDGRLQSKIIGSYLGGVSDNIIPTWSSTTSPDGGELTTSLDETPWQLFDKNPNTTINLSSATTFIEYRFPKEKIITKFTIAPVGGQKTDYAPRYAHLEGYHESSGEWVSLFRSEDPIVWTTSSTTTNEKKEFVFDNTTPYQSYRILTHSKRGSGWSLKISEIEMMELIEINTYASQGTWTSPIIDLGIGWKETKELSYLLNNANISSDKNVIPVMTSNNSPSGVASASSDFGLDWSPWRAFDGIKTATGGNGNNRWASARNVSGPHWLSYKFENPLMVTKYNITSNPVSGSGQVEQNVKTWTFEASNDGEEWVVLDEQENAPQWGVSETREFNISNKQKYLYYRVHIKQTQGNIIACIGELEMFSLESSIQVATSNDGVSFTDFIDLTEEELPQARYLKIRATLSAESIGDGEEVVYLFDQSTEENIVTLNKYVEANGQLKLKQDYEFDMAKDGSWSEEGSLHTISVVKSDWKKINSISIG